MSDLINTDTSDGVVTIRLNRPDKKNALTSAMYTALSDVIEAANGDPVVGAIVLLGQPGCFTAGNDIGDFLAMSASAGGLGAPVMRFLHNLATLEKPLVAGIDGIAMGIGTTLTFHCDLVYASPEASFLCPFLELGLLPEAASTLLGPRIMGPNRAFELLCLGQRFSAQDGFNAGFVNRIVPSRELEKTVLAAARALAAKPPAAMAIARTLMRGDRADILARLDQEAALFAERLSSDEAREAFTAFMDKRPPNFNRAG